MPSIVISIEGNIGSGKSTLLSYAQKYFQDRKYIKFVREPVDIWTDIKDADGNNMLAKFYDNQKKYAFSFQMMAYISRLSLIKKAVEQNPFGIIITERSVLTDRNIFAKMLHDEGKMEDVEYQIYLKWFDEFIDCTRMNGTIYVRASPEVCFTRICNRGRIEEQVPIGYLKRCHLYHEEWMKRIKEEHMITIDANTDIGQDTNAMNNWLWTIERFIAIQMELHNNKHITSS